MENKRMSIKEEGITLVALVVTIIVLLILAGVTINMVLGENGIIQKAKSAKNISRAAEVLEQRDFWWAEIEIDNISGKNTARELSDVLDDLESKDLITSDEREQIENNGEVTIENRKIEFTDKRLAKVAKVGDYVNYSPDTTIAQYKLEMKYTGRESDYNLSKEDFRWRILKINEDCSINLVADHPSNGKFIVGGYPGIANRDDNKLGYTNAVFLLNDLCKTMYSNSKYGNARSINMADVLENLELETENTVEQLNQASIQNEPSLDYTKYAQLPNARQIRFYYNEITTTNSFKLTSMGEFQVATRLYNEERFYYSWGIGHGSLYNGVEYNPIYGYITNSTAVATWKNSGYLPVIELKNNVRVLRYDKENEEWLLE